MPFKDAEKNKEARRNWYFKDPSKQYKYKRNREIENKKWIDSLKTPCIVCGFFHVAAIDFHHVDPTIKDIEISKLVKAGWSRERMKKEIDKCVCLCSNCHRIEHWNQKFGSLV